MTADTPTQKVIEPYLIDSSGHWRFRYHDGQKRVMSSEARFILMLAGTQVGKTVIGPWWMLREIARRGPGDYMIVAPSYPLMNKKVVPEVERLMHKRLHLGEYKTGERVFVFSPRGQESIHGTIPETPTQIFFGHAQDSDSLESATAKAAWLDEAGQKKFKRESWEAIQRRLSIHEGRALITTTPYTLGWLKTELHDRAATDADIDLIRFESIMNPTFPKAEFERMRGNLPRWKFDMMYRGIFTRPAGMIYDCFDRDVHLIPRFEIPSSWPRYLGLDFGAVNTAGVFLAREPRTNRYILYREYKAGSRTAAQHTSALLQGEPQTPTSYGGAGSEDNWRQEFKAANLPVRKPPIPDVEVGIDRTYAMFKLHPSLNQGASSAPYIEIFDDLAGVIDEIESYSRVLDENSEPTDRIEDKETYHRLDALRYIAARINDKGQDWSKIKLSGRRI